MQVSHDAIKAHLATKYHDEYDRAVEGFMRRMMGGAGAANQAWATKRQRKEGPNPKRFKNNARPGYHDGAARLLDMDLDGVSTEVIYSELSFFRQGRSDREPTRHHGRVQRGAALGAKSLQLPVFPPELGLPDYYHERYDQLLALIQETGLPICCHIEPGVENIMWSSDYPHPVSSFPNSRTVAAQCVAALPERERELMTSGNAKRVWNL